MNAPTNLVTRRRLAVLLVVALAIVAAGITPSSGADPATSEGILCDTDAHDTFSLTARDGYATTPDGNSIYMWSYADSTGDFQMPGPVLCVTAGEHVTVTLLNTLPEPTSITFPGQQHVTADGKPAQPQLNDAGALTSMVQAADAPDASGSPATPITRFTRCPPEG